MLSASCQQLAALSSKRQSGRLRCKARSAPTAAALSCSMQKAWGEPQESGELLLKWETPQNAVTETESSTDLESGDTVGAFFQTPAQHWIETLDVQV